MPDINPISIRLFNSLFMIPFFFGFNGLVIPQVSGQPLKILTFVLSVLENGGKQHKT